MKEYVLRQKFVDGKYSEELVISDVLNPLSPLYCKLTPLSCEVCEEYHVLYDFRSSSANRLSVVYKSLFVVLEKKHLKEVDMTTDFEIFFSCSTS